jgi:hypothetical protein
VAADYRINAYFRDSNGLYVNLYLPSTLRWTQDGSQLSLTQKSDYPLEGGLRLELTASKSTEFSIHLRIPAWAQGASIAVNGKRVPGSYHPGQFAELHRVWKNSDRIEVEFPMPLRLESIDARHPRTVALLRGPLVLFAITDAPSVVSVQQLLAAKRTRPQTWQVQTSSGAISMLPFTAIAEQQYSTYLTAS